MEKNTTLNHQLKGLVEPSNFLGGVVILKNCYNQNYNHVNKLQVKKQTRNKLEDIDVHMPVLNNGTSNSTCRYFLYCHNNFVQYLLAHVANVLAVTSCVVTICQNT